MRILLHHVNKFEDSRLTGCNITLKKQENRSNNHFYDEEYKKMRRWAASQVGRPFDEVFSKWTKLPWVPVKLRHIKGFRRIVDMDIVTQDNKLYYIGYGGLTDMGHIDCLYVDPRDGIIKHQKVKKYKRPAPPVECIILTDYTQLYKSKGIWYFMELPQKVEKITFNSAAPAVFVNVPPRMKFVDFHHKFLTSWFFRKTKYIKESLSKKQLRKFGLRND